MTDTLFISLFKTSSRDNGRMHLEAGYPLEDFPLGMQQDGHAYFARDRWIAELFASERFRGYEDFVIEVLIPTDVYNAEFLQFECRAFYDDREGCEVVIPRELLPMLNRYERRSAVMEEPAE